MEVDARLLPLALHGSLADIPGSRDFREGKSAKILQVNNLREGWFGLGEFLERLTDANEVAVVNRVLDFGSERGDLELAAALLGPATSRMIDYQAAHDPSGIAHESPAVSEGCPVFACDFDIRLVEQGDGTQADRPAFPGELISR
jgi:hypothetical protein